MQFPARARYAPRACRCCKRTDDNGVVFLSAFASFFGEVAPAISGDRPIPARTAMAVAMTAIFIGLRSVGQYSGSAAPSRGTGHPLALHFPAQAEQQATPQPYLSP